MPLDATISNDDLEGLLAGAATGQPPAEEEPEPTPEPPEAAEQQQAAPEQEAPAAEQEPTGEEAPKPRTSAAVTDADLEALLADAQERNKARAELNEADEGEPEQTTRKLEPNTPEEIAAFESKVERILKQMDDVNSNADVDEEEPEPEPAAEPEAEAPKPEKAPEPDEALDPDDADGALSRTVDDILSTLDDPTGEVVSGPGTVEAQPTSDEIESLSRIAAKAVERNEIRNDLDAMLQEEVAPPSPAFMRKDVVHMPPLRRFTTTHAILLINSVVLIVLVVGQFNFNRYASTVNANIESRISEAMIKTESAVARLRDQLVHPTPMPELASPREYTRLLEEADIAFAKGDGATAGTLYLEIIGKFPRHTDNDHVRFYLGECFTIAVPPQWREARGQFSLVMQNFPHGKYVALAHLRSARCDSRLGAYDRAQHTLLQLLANEALYGLEAAPILSEARYRLSQYYELDARNRKLDGKDAEIDGITALPREIN